MRAAVFYVPEDDDPLLQAGSSWLGRNATTGAAMPQPSPKLACITAAPARYGFHATLKPPMHLATGLDALSRDVALLAASLKPFPLPSLSVGFIGGALALLTNATSADLQNLSDACVARLDNHRLPPDAAELARRREAALSPRQQAMLQLWGYPYVFEEWQFHMTLSSALPAKIASARATWARDHFTPSLAIEREVKSLALVIEPQPGAGFLLAERFPLSIKEVFLFEKNKQKPFGN